MAAPYVLDSINPPVNASVAVASPSRTLTFPGKTLLWTVAATLAALLALPLATTFDGRFPIENLDVEMTNRIRNNRNDAIAWAKERSNRWESMYRTTVACLVGFGATLGGVAALLGAATTAPVLVRLRWLAAGIVLGAVCAALGGYLESGLLIKIEKLTLDPMIRTMLGHAVAWLVLGVGVAIAATLSVSGWSAKLAAVGRCSGGALAAAVLYTPLAAILFQLQRSDLTIPEGAGNKLLFIGLAAVSMLGMLGSLAAQSTAASPSSMGEAPASSAAVTSSQMATA